MAKVVLGMGTSHGPMLVTPPDQWGLRVGADQAAMHPWRGKEWSYDDLKAARAEENLAAQLTPKAKQLKYDRCWKAIREMARVFAEAKPDVAVILGNDQMEIFNDKLVPAFGVMYGPEIPNLPLSAEKLESLPPGVKEAMSGYIPQGGATYDAVEVLGQHIVSDLMDNHFDIAAMQRFPKEETPHAYGFVYRHIMNDDPVPSVPVFINTFYPPNQPRVRRCFDLGTRILDSIHSWDSDARVAIIASGGLTHFTIDEDMDKVFLDAMRDGDVDTFESLGENVYQAGTSELKNWIPLAGAMNQLGFKMEVVDYVPVYRSEAGTGNAMGFVHWRP